MPKNDIASAVAKIQSIMPSNYSSDTQRHTDQIAVDLTPWSNEYDNTTLIQDIRAAIKNRNLISFTYLDTNGNLSKREVEPYRLIYKVRNWYLQGYCLLRKDFRVFKVSRLSSLTKLDCTFNKRDCPTLELYAIKWTELEHVAIKMKIDENVKALIDFFYKSQAVFESKQGTLYAYFPFFYTPFEYNIILGFADKCECLEPEDVRLEIRRLVKNMNNIYR